MPELDSSSHATMEWAGVLVDEAVLMQLHCNINQILVSNSMERKNIKNEVKRNGQKVTKFKVRLTYNQSGCALASWCAVHQLLEAWDGEKEARREVFPQHMEL